MDIFNKKRIEELERRNMRLEHDLRKYMDRAGRAEDALEKFLELKGTQPDDCTSGIYCKACEFVKEFSYYGGHGSVPLYGYCCGKGTSCKNFIQQKTED